MTGVQTCALPILKRSSADDLKGADAAHNAKALRSVLRGEPSAFRDAAVMTAAAALVVAGRDGDMRSAVAQAQAAIDGGAALRALETLVRVSNG